MLEAVFHFPSWHILLLCSSTSPIKCQIPTWITSFATLCCAHTKHSSQHISCSIFLVGKIKEQMNIITHCHFILKTLPCCDSYRKKISYWLDNLYTETTSSPAKQHYLLSLVCLSYQILYFSCLYIAKSIEPSLISVLHLCKMNNTEIQRNPGSWLLTLFLHWKALLMRLFSPLFKVKWRFTSVMEVKRLQKKNPTLKKWYNAPLKNYNKPLYSFTCFRLSIQNVSLFLIIWNWL